MSLGLNITWPADFIWSSFPIYQAIEIAKRTKRQIIFKDSGVNSLLVNHLHDNMDTTADMGILFPRNIVIILLVVVWGIRFTANFVRRGGIGHEDWRYTDMRVQYGKYFWWASLFTVFLGQTIFLFGATTSLYPAILSNSSISDCGLKDLVGMVLAVISISLETVADRQMDTFVAELKSKKHNSNSKPKKLINDSGLRAYVRFPNYLGEILFWWSMFILANPEETWVIVGPILLTFLIGTVSIKLMENRQKKRKRKQWEVYCAKVRYRLLPFIY